MKRGAVQLARLIAKGNIVESWERWNALPIGKKFAIRPVLQVLILGLGQKQVFTGGIDQRAFVWPIRKAISVGVAKERRQRRMILRFSHTIAEQLEHRFTIGFALWGFVIEQGNHLWIVGIKRGALTCEQQNPFANPLMRCHAIKDRPDVTRETGALRCL